MRQLNSREISDVNGGNPLVGIAWGLVGSYTYDALGGYEGINNYFSQVGQSVVNGSAYNSTFGSYNYYGKSNAYESHAG
jgi:hypothetical protein